MTRARDLADGADKDIAGTLTLDDIVLSNDMSVADNGKAIFGAGNDLQIYHDSNNSYVQDQGTGSLRLGSDSVVQIGKATAWGELMAQFTADGGCELRHDNAAKLNTTSTGVNVTGTMTADGIDSTCAAGDGNLALQAYHPTSTSARDIAKFQSNVGGTQVDQMIIGCDGNVDINGTVTADAATLSGTSPVLSYSDTDNSITAQIGSGTSDFNIATTSAHNLDIRTNNTRRMVVESDGDISFYADNGTTQGFFWDASTQRLGLGTTSPAERLHVFNGSSGRSSFASNTDLIIEDNGNSALQFASPNTNVNAIYFSDPESNTAGVIQYSHITDAMSFDTNDTTRMTIDSSGRVGIGTTTLTDKLNVEGDIRINNAVESPNNLNLEAENGSMRFYTGSGSPSERMRITSGGSVNIGSTSNTQAKFEISNALSTTGSLTDTHINLATSNNTGRKLNIGFGLGGGVANTNAATIGFDVTSGSGALQGDLFFSTRGSTADSVPTERMRLSSAGNLQVGQNGTVNTSGTNSGVNISAQYGTFQANYHGNDYPILNIHTSGSNNRYFNFRFGNSSVGNITTNGSSTTYATTSDYRVKENAVDMTGAITRVKSLQPKRFNFIADDSVTVDGFLAHEAQTVVPEAITGTHNEVDADGNAVMQGIDQSKLVPLLTGALQEAIAKIETLETKVAALENA